MDKVTGMMSGGDKSSRDQMDRVTCMSLEEMEWSISIAEQEEVQECDIPDSNGVQQSIYIYIGTPMSGRYSIIDFFILY